MRWVHFYKVDQDILITYLEGTDMDPFTQFLGLLGVPYTHIDSMIYFKEKELRHL